MNMINFTRRTNFHALFPSIYIFVRILGLPKAWIRIMNSQITPDEQQKNPDAAYQALKFYNFSIKKREPAEGVFKPFITEADIDEESKQIANYVNLKSTHKSQDSLSSGSEKDVNLSSEEPPPPLPAKNKVKSDEPSKRHINVSK